MTLAALADAGTVAPLVRRLVGAVDPLALYARVADGGRTPDTAVLESADRGDHTGERSLVSVRAALRLGAGAESVLIEALSPNGKAALEFVKTRFPSATEPTADDRWRLSFSAQPASDDERTRFRRPSPFDVLRELAFGPTLIAAPNPWCHLLVGTFGYDAIDYFEHLSAGPPDPLAQPVLEFWLPEQLVVIDHTRQSTTVIATVWGGPGAERRFHDANRALAKLVATVVATQADAAPPRSAGNANFGPAHDRKGAAAQATPADPTSTVAQVDQDDAEYGRVVAKLQEHIAAGDVYQIVPSRTFSLPCSDSLGAYAALRTDNPSPYLFYLAGADRVLFGASPETCLRVDGPSRRATVVPIAGTVARGRGLDGRIDPDADTRNEVTLRLDPKELAEHLMLVDLARNDIARISVPGTRVVSRLLTVERYAHVMHLVSEVTGTLVPGLDALEAYASTMPMGTLVGAPKVRAAELLRGSERSRRGAYGGGVGYLLHDGTLETAIVIRSAVVANGVGHVRAGAGVVLDSDPAREADETRRKARSVLDAIARPARIPHHG